MRQNKMSFYTITYMRVKGTVKAWQMRGDRTTRGSGIENVSVALRVAVAQCSEMSQDLRF